MAVDLQAGGPPGAPISEQRLSATESDAGKRLDAFLVQSLGVGRRAAARLVASTRINGRRATKGHRLAAGDEVVVSIPEPDPTGGLEPTVLRATPGVLVVAKPAGLPSVEIPGHPSPSLASWAAATFPECSGVGAPGEHGLAHRLDTETSGLVLIARSLESHLDLRAQFRRHEIEKTYLAVVWGRIDRPLSIDAPIGQHYKSRRRVRALQEGASAERYASSPASTLITPLQVIGPASVVSASTSTGARHQIRAHLAFAGHPLVGDRLHAGDRPPLLDTHLLHASALSWRLPGDGTLQTDQCHEPVTWQAALDRLARAPDHRTGSAT